jgi:maleate isomerase
MEQKFGWRGRVGLILTSSQVITEPLFNQVAPRGIAFHATRIFIGGTQPSHVLETEKEKDRAIKEIVTTRPNLVVDCCTMAGMLRGVEGDREYCQEITARTAIPFTSTVQAIDEALKALGVRRLVVITPYPKAADDEEKSFLERSGYEVVNIRGLGAQSGAEICSITPQQAYDFAKSTWVPGADALLASCMNFYATLVVQALEMELKVPVISSHTCTLWKILRMLNIHEPVPGYGRLLSDYC